MSVTEAMEADVVCAVVLLCMPCCCAAHVHKLFTHYVWPPALAAREAGPCTLPF